MVVEMINTVGRSEIVYDENEWTDCILGVHNCLGILELATVAQDSCARYPTDRVETRGRR